MKVKCRYCGGKIEKKDAFQAPTGSGNFYYCNEEEYNIKEFEKQQKQEEQQRIREEKKQQRLAEAKKRYEERVKAQEEKRKIAEEQQKIIEKEGNKNPNIVDPIYEIVSGILGRRVNGNAAFKEIDIWRSHYDDKKILAYLQENRDYITKAINRAKYFNDYAHMRYISAIVMNNLPKYNKQPEPEPVKIKVDCEMYVPVVSSKKKRRGLSELEDEV